VGEGWIAVAFLLPALAVIGVFIIYPLDRLRLLLHCGSHGEITNRHH
jgi:hypothetical protein